MYYFLKKLDQELEVKSIYVKDDKATFSATWWQESVKHSSECLIGVGAGWIMEKVDLLYLGSSIRRLRIYRWALQKIKWVGQQC